MRGSPPPRVGILLGEGVDGVTGDTRPGGDGGVIEVDQVLVYSEMSRDQACSFRSRITVRGQWMRSVSSSTGFASLK